MANDNKTGKNIISELGLEKLSDEQKAEVLENVGALVEQSLLIRMMDSLAQEKREQFSKIIMDGKKEELQQFVEENFPDYLAWMEEEIGKAKAELKAFTQKQ